MSRKFTDVASVAEFIKSSVDIYDVIAEDLGLKSGQQDSNSNITILCPFHNERTPSFNINIRKQAYRCFGGCQESGDVIKWYQDKHGASFPEAIERLAERFSLDLSPYIRPSTAEEVVRDRYQYIFNAAAEWCHTQLMGNALLLQYYKDETGFNEDLISQYKVGYSPSSDALVNFVYQKIPNVTKDEVRKLELDDRVRFDDSLVYPIHDLTGNTSRIYVKPLHPPPDASYKYLGTSATHPLFKRDLVYGLYEIKKEIKKQNHQITLVEGFKACIAAGGVAVMGTNVTDEQVATIKACGVRSVVCCFDGDQAGYLASLRVLEDVNKFRGLMLKVARMPMDTQCDTLVKMSGHSALQSVLKNALLPIEYLVSSRFDTTGKLSIESKFQLLADVAPLLAKMPTVEVDLSAAYLASVLGTGEESIRSYVHDIKAAGSRLTNTRAEESVLHSVLIDASKWVQLKTGLFDATYFSLSEHQNIYKAMDAGYKEHAAELTARVVLDKISALFPGDAERLTKRVDVLFALEPEYEFSVACTITQDLWQRRTAIKQAQDLQVQMMDLNKTPKEALHTFRKTVVSAVDMRRAQAVTPLAVSQKTVVLIEERMSSGKKILGFDFSSRLPVVNAVLSGIQLEHQILVAANQGVGKSLLAQNIVIPIAIEQGIPTLWLNQEMVDCDINLRIISAMAGLNNTKLQMGGFDTTDDYHAFKDAESRYAAGNLYIRQPELGTAEEIYAIIEEMKFKYGIQVVVWDYIQLVGQGRDQNGVPRDQVIGAASKMMTNKVAHGLHMASICISQLNRSNFKKGEVREAESVSGAYSLAQDADDIITLSEKDDKQIEEQGNQRGNRIIFIDKRRGGTSNIAIHANLDDCDGTTLRFKECVTPEEYAGYAKQFGGLTP